MLHCWVDCQVDEFDFTSLEAMCGDVFDSLKESERREESMSGFMATLKPKQLLMES
jgi:hypothetical protein